MNRKKVIMLFVIMIIFLTFFYLLLPKDKQFSSFEKVMEYLRVNDDVSVIKTLDIDEFKFIAVASEDGYNFTSKTVYSKNNKLYLFKATVLNTIMLKSVLFHYFIEVYKINNHYVVIVHTWEFDSSGNLISVSDSDGSDFSQLKITDRSVDFYRVYTELPKDYVIYSGNKSFKIN